MAATDTSDVARDPSAYQLTIHAMQKRRDRGISIDDIETTIRDGEIRNTHQSDTRLLVADVVGQPHPVAVCVHLPSGDIRTVYKKDGDPPPRPR